MWAHFGGCPVTEAAIVHGKAIVMLGHWYHVFCTRLFKELSPGICIELIGFEHRNEVLVAELLY